MKNFFLIIFFRLQIIFRDDFSAMAVLAYVLSLNVYTLLGLYKYFFQHSSLSEVPLIYSLFIMVISGIFTNFILLGDIRNKNILEKLKQKLIKKSNTGLLLTLIYIIGSFTILLQIV